MAAALRSLQKLGSIGVAATTLSHSSSAQQRRRFEGKTIVITGGGGTFGRVGAKYFAERGAKVVLVDVNQAALDQINEVGVTTCACDVRDPTQVQAVINACGRVDLLWNNAGYQGAMKPLLEYPGDDFQRVMDINVVGAFRVLQACAKNMAANGGGAIVQTGSVAGLRGTPTMGAYVASKAAIHGLTMTASKDLAPHSIRVNTVMPALIGPSSGFMWQRQNELHAASGSPYFDRDAAVVAAKKVNGVPLKRLGEVEEVVEAVAFLLSDESAYITGTSLVVAGGMA
jgi:NAD(P)-dependent dehydrogenase (short-subunit alcohol dehydrogenase family)